MDFISIKNVLFLLLKSLDLLSKQFIKVLKLFFRNQKFWLVCLVYAVVSGVTNGWLSVIYINLKPLNITQVRIVYNVHFHIWMNTVIFSVEISDW